MECKVINFRKALTIHLIAFRSWNIDHFGLAHTKIKLLEDKLGMLNLDFNGEATRRLQVLEDLRIQRARMKSILRQKFHEIWLKEGD